MPRSSPGGGAYVVGWCLAGCECVAYYYHPSDFRQAADKCQQLIRFIAAGQLLTRADERLLSDLFWASSCLQICHRQPYMLTVFDERFGEDGFIGALTLSSWQAYQLSIFPLDTLDNCQIRRRIKKPL